MFDSRTRIETRWIAVATTLVLIELCVAMFMQWKTGFHYGPAILGYFLLGSYVTFAIVVLCVLATLASYPFRGVDSPLQQMRADIRASGVRVLAIGIGFLLAIMQICILNWTKSMIPLVSSYWADPLLIRMDRALFGQDPWRLLQWMNGTVVDWFYAAWSTRKFGTLIVLFLLPISHKKGIGLTAYFLTMAMGILIGQYALPSVGPIFLERFGISNEFADLRPSPIARMSADYLWAAHLDKMNGVVGGGISAFPSMHVAMSVWATLVWFSYNRWLGIAGLGFTVMICLGSVYLGWHYAMDGIASIAIAFLAWVIARRIYRGAEGDLPDRKIDRTTTKPAMA